jgi:hypothetical protein
MGGIFSAGGCMSVVDKVMGFFDFERCDEPATPTTEGKVLYKKRGVELLATQNLLNTSSDSADAARAHVELTLFDKAILWIFEKIVSPFMTPLPRVSNFQEVSDVLVPESDDDPLPEKKSDAEEEFLNQRQFIKTFLQKESWPNGFHHFSDDVIKIAKNHWESFEKLKEKCSVGEEDRLTYAAAAYVLGEESPSFRDDPKESAPYLSLVDLNDSEVEMEASTDKIMPSQKSSGEILFNGFHNLDQDKKSVEFLSLGSVYMQSDCLEFAQNIINKSFLIKTGYEKKFTSELLESAKLLHKLKRQLDNNEQSRINKEKLLQEKNFIEEKNSSKRLGELDFEYFVNDFLSHKKNDRKFILFQNGNYRAKPDLLSFAEQVQSDSNETPLRKEAATYLILWNRHPIHAEKAANEANGFSMVTPPPPPPPPPPRKVAVPKVEPVPVAPEQLAIIRLINADSRHQEQLRTLIGLSTSIMQSGLAVLDRIWQSDASSSSKHLSPVQPQMRTVTADDEAYTDLEEIDNAIKLITELANMNTSHSFVLSDDVEKIKVNSESIIQNLMRQRSQIIARRKILPMRELTENQIASGQRRFDDFRSAYVSARSREHLHAFKVRDVYFSDESISYASHIHGIFLNAGTLVDKDQEACDAAEYLLNKYNQFTSQGSPTIA